MIRTILTLAIGFVIGTIYGIIYSVEEPSGAVVKVAELIKALF